MLLLRTGFVASTGSACGRTPLLPESTVRCANLRVWRYRAGGAEQNAGTAHSKSSADGLSSGATERQRSTSRSTVSLAVPRAVATRDSIAAIACRARPR